MHTGIDFLPSFFCCCCLPSVQPFIYLAKPLPLGARWKPPRSLWEDTHWIQQERRLQRNVDLFPFIRHLSATAALLQSIILVCVWCSVCVGMHERVCVFVSTIRPHNHNVLHRPPDPFFCVNNDTPANHGRKEWGVLEKRLNIQPLTRLWQAGCVSTEQGMERGRQEGRVSNPLSSLLLLPSLSLYVSTTEEPVKPLPIQPSPQIKVVQRQWLRFLHSMLRRGQNW